MLENAEKKLKKKGADMIVANDVSHNVFGNDYDQVTLLTQDGHIDKWPRMSKQEIAYGLIEKIARELK